MRINKTKYKPKTKKKITTAIPHKLSRQRGGTIRTPTRTRGHSKRKAGKNGEADQC